MTQTDYFKDCRTLDEARKVYYRLAMEFHPDRGGDEELFKQLANQFHAFKRIRPTNPSDNFWIIGR